MMLTLKAFPLVACDPKLQHACGLQWVHVILVECHAGMTFVPMTQWLYCYFLGRGKRCQIHGYAWDSPTQGSYSTNEHPC